MNFIRSSLGKIPRNASVLSKSKLPLAFTISTHPKPLRDSTDSVPLINAATDQAHLVRCRRCRSYLNPYVEMIDQGTRWKCNLCFLINDFPPNFDFDPQTNTYIDRNRRPELTCPVYEFLAPVEYCSRPPQPPVFVFVLDVSWPAITTGMLPNVIKDRALVCCHKGHL
jgi:protein transport protein SEC24